MWNPTLVHQVQHWMAQLFVWDVAEKQHINRAAIATGYGLPDAIYARPFPGSQGTSLNLTVQEKPAPPAAMRRPNGLAKAALLTALTFSAGGAGFGLASLLNRPATTPAGATSATSGFLIDLVPPDKAK